MFRPILRPILFVSLSLRELRRVAPGFYLPACALSLYGFSSSNARQCGSIRRHPRRHVANVDASSHRKGCHFTDAHGTLRHRRSTRERTLARGLEIGERGSTRGANLLLQSQELINRTSGVSSTPLLINARACLYRRCSGIGRISVVVFCFGASY
ncbi:hypothetical protein ALC53_13997 [Atta colombica]|uniref:Uncharacterized protein n=1 Tax=Atta colombica TaxID=520822 RepID=A0A195AUA9_9HYME|nr:hypothetical protein ALC53_13997 [Atta colombica]